MQILSIETFSDTKLLDSLKQTKLRGFDGARPYEAANLVVERGLDSDDLAPAQRYVLLPGVRKVLELREALLAHDVDIFSLSGGVFVRTSDSPDEAIPVIPPVVEQSIEPDGRSVLIINDGIHRVFAARSLGLPIDVVVAYGVSPEYPYYALALERGWSEVQELEELPDEFQKKEYRVPENYKSLFREFNEVFPGVQKDRKRSNPAELKQ